MAAKKPMNQAKKRQLIITMGVALITAALLIIAMSLAQPNERVPAKTINKPTVTRMDAPGTQAASGPSYESAIDAKVTALASLVEETQANAARRQNEAVAQALAQQKEEASKTPYKIFDPSKIGESLPQRTSPEPEQTAVAPTSSLTTLRFSVTPASTLSTEQNDNGQSASSYSILSQSPEAQEAYRNVGRSLRGENTVGVSGQSLDGQAAPPNTQTYLPSGTFFQVTNLNGLDAPTGGQAQNNPVPMLLSVTSMGQLPNRFKSDVKQCFVTAQGWGDLSSERAYIRTESLSCVRKNGDVVDIPIQGYVVGGDGKVGLRGRVVSKQGQILANALWVSMLSSFGEVSKAAATTVNVSSGGTISANTGSQSTSDLLRQGALSGLGEAAKSLSAYYISLAEKLWPVIEVDPGQGAEIVLSKGSSLLQQPGSDTGAGLSSISDQLSDASSGLSQGLSKLAPTFNLNIGGASK